MVDSDITADEIHDLLDYFSLNTFRAKQKCDIALQVQEKCLLLMKEDDAGQVLLNEDGLLCSHYPTKMFVDSKSFMGGEDSSNMEKLQELVKNSRVARARSRFVAPVIFYGNKVVCRSATLSSSAELYGRSGLAYGRSGLAYLFNNQSKEDCAVTTKSDQQSSSNNRDLLNKARQSDIELLKELKVQHIVDLMVEKKKVKFGMYVTSSEKVDKENRYRSFNIISMPYPGCEIFREFQLNNYSAEQVFFDWNQPFVDATFCIPTLDDPSLQDIKWQDLENLSTTMSKRLSVDEYEM